MEPKSKISQVMPAWLVQKRGEGEGWRRGGGGWWYFQVYKQAMDADLLAFKPGLSWPCQVCSIVRNRRVHLSLVAFDLFFSQQRSGEPSHSRAGLTSIGLQIERTPLSDQTSPRRAPSHSFKTSSKWAFSNLLPESGRSRTCIIVAILRVETSVSADSPAGLPGHNQSSVRSNRETTDCETPSRCVSPLRSVPNSLPPPKRLGRTSGNTII